MRLARIVAVLGVLVSAPTLAQTPSPPLSAAAPVGVDAFAALIDEAARRFAVPTAWVRLVMRAESGGRADAMSPKGAIGLMQIMPGTYARLRQIWSLGADPFQPHDNILAGAAYLREMYDRYGSPGFLAAYNAGPGRYESHLATGRPLPEETQAYLARLAPMVASVQAGRMSTAPDPLAWTRAPLFILRAATADRRATSSDADRAAPAADVPPISLRAGPIVADATALSPRSEGLFVGGGPEAPRR